MKTTPPAVYEVRFGRRDPEEPEGFKVLATYNMSGFREDFQTGEEVSRFDQAMMSVGDDRLPLPEGVDWVEMDRVRKDAAAESIAAARLLTGSGLVAQPVGPVPLEAPATRWDFGPETPRAIGAFPVRSIFESAG